MIIKKYKSFFPKKYNIKCFTEKFQTNTEEIIQIVNEKNEIIGSEKRGLAYKNGLYKRSTNIFITNNKRLYIQKRSLNKNWAPGYWDLCFGGLLTPNETFEKNAYREAYEELGVHGIFLKKIGDFVYKDERSKGFSEVFTGEFRGNICIQEEEVQFVKLLHKFQVEEMIEKKEKIAEDGLKAYSLFKEFIDF